MKDVEASITGTDAASKSVIDSRVCLLKNNGDTKKPS